MFHVDLPSTLRLGPLFFKNHNMFFRPLTILVSCVGCRSIRLSNVMSNSHTLHWVRLSINVYETIVDHSFVANNFVILKLQFEEHLFQRLCAYHDSERSRIHDGAKQTT